jgi:hypothetical protein
VSCLSRTYPLNAAQAVAICQKIETLSGLVIDPTKTSGETHTHGCDITYVITGDAITFSFPSKPFLMPCSVIFDHLDTLFTPQGAKL